MVRRIAALAALIALAAPAAAAPARGVRPRAFASCADLVSYGRRNIGITHGVPARAPTPLATPTVVARPVEGDGTAPQPAATAPAAAESPTFSTTNNQEAGVDEPDVVKTDGATIFAIAQGKLFAVDARGAEPRLAGTLDLGSAGFGAQLLLRGDRLIVISPSAGQPIPLAAGAPFLIREQTIVTEVDVHDTAAMKVARTMTIDGRFVDARQNGSTARVVIASSPRAVAEPATAPQPRGWVPARRFRSRLTGRHYVRRVSGCAAIRRTARFSGLGMLTILTIDLERGLWAADSDALMADAQVVYGSTGSLYVATQRWADPARPPAQSTTVIHRFDVSDPDRTTFVSSGEVPGYLLNQFSLSEYRGHLRAATTSRPIWSGAGPPAELSQSHVTILEERGARLERVGQVDGLGKGEQIYSVRFVDDVGYVVTFRQIDPLYTIDLAKPTAPRVAGELKIQGYSAYLHPIGKDRLLGVGVDVGDASGRPQGAQVVLFDVADAAAPKLLARMAMGDGSASAVQFDHHAFLYWPASRLAMLPLQDPGRFTGAVGLRVDPAGLAEVGRVAHEGSPPIERSVVIGERLFTLSEDGLLASRLDTLARQGFVAFH